MMKHDHLDVIDMKIEHERHYICLALPHGDSDWIGVDKDAYDRLKIKTKRKK